MTNQIIQPDLSSRPLRMTAPGTKSAETVVTVELTPSRSGTRVRLTHAGFPDEESKNRHAQARPNALDRLDKVLRAAR